MLIIFPICLLMGKTEAAVKLSKQKPLGALISRFVFLSLIGQMLLIVLFQLLVFFDVRSQSWYYRPAVSSRTKENIVCFETTSVFLMNSCQTISVAMAYSISKPFKRPLYTNRIYAIALMLIWGLMMYMIVAPDVYTYSILQLMHMPMSYRLRLVGYVLLHLICAYAFESLVINSWIGKSIISAIRIRRKRRKPHAQIRAAMLAEAQSGGSVTLTISSGK
jgi:cation-transporting P-type ATPase 13A2